MKYLLTVLTNGRLGYLGRTLRAFAEMVEPKPAAVYVYDDGATVPRSQLVDRIVPGIAPTVWVDGVRARAGMCAAYQRCWRAAADSDYDWVFHIEDDHVLLRPVYLRHLAAVLDAVPALAQMALVRTPWGAEVEHGGYIPQSPGWYQRRHSGLYPEDVEGLFATEWIDATNWIEHKRNWTLAPALFRTSLARAHPWPTESGCETAIGRSILTRDPEALFGLWGAGECQVAHIGVERAPGAWGY